MGEHLFPANLPRGRDLLDAAVLHRLLAGGMRRVGAAHLAGELAGRAPTRAEVHAVRRSLARLARAGLVDRTGTTARATRAARRFHQLMLGGDDPPPTPHHHPSDHER